MHLYSSQHVSLLLRHCTFKAVKMSHEEMWRALLASSKGFQLLHAERIDGVLPAHQPCFVCSYAVLYFTAMNNTASVHCCGCTMLRVHSDASAHCCECARVRACRCIHAQEERRQAQLQAQLDLMHQTMQQRDQFARQAAADSGIVVNFGEQEFSLFRFYYMQ